MKHTQYIVLIYSLLWIVSACKQTGVTPDIQTSKSINIFPDYTGVTFPSNIAPPNFRIMEKGEEYYTEIGNQNQIYTRLRSKQPSVVIPQKKWKELLNDTTGNIFYIRICIQQDNKWKRVR